MEDLTKEIIDDIIDKFCKNELSVYIKKDDNGNQVYEISKGKERSLLQRRLDDKIPENKKNEKQNIICYIKVNNTDHRATIHYRSFLSIDSDGVGIYSYTKKFLALVRSKVRQTNAWGIKVKLGIISIKEFNDLDESFSKNRELLVNEIYTERSSDIVI